MKTSSKARGTRLAQIRIREDQRSSKKSPKSRKIQPTGHASSLSAPFCFDSFEANFWNGLARIIVATPMPSPSRHQRHPNHMEAILERGATKSKSKSEMPQLIGPELRCLSSSKLSIVATPMPSPSRDHQKSRKFQLTGVKF